jgi:hypothetical protein
MLKITRSELGLCPIYEMNMQDVTKTLTSWDLLYKLSIDICTQMEQHFILLIDQPIAE